MGRTILTILAAISLAGCGGYRVETGGKTERMALDEALGLLGGMVDDQAVIDYCDALLRQVPIWDSSP